MSNVCLRMARNAACLLIILSFGVGNLNAEELSENGLSGVFVALWASPIAELWTTPVMKSDLEARATAVQAHRAQLESDQARVIQGVLGKSASDRVLYQAQVAVNAIAMLVTPEELSLLSALPEVKSVSPILDHEPASVRSMDWINAPEVWDPGEYGRTGAGVRVGLIDTGVDYIHKHLGGSGAPADYASVNPSSADPALFPNAKVVGGVDLAGTGATWPIPNPNDNPYDVFGHGTETASIVGGLGVTGVGNAYAGPYDQTPDYANFIIAAGVAPEAELYAIKVSPDNAPSSNTALLVGGIEWALDPDGDGLLDDHLDVALLAYSLESQPVDHDSVALTAVRNAMAVGMLLVGITGNEGNDYGLAMGWGQGAEGLSVAASTKPHAYGKLGLRAQQDSPPAQIDFDVLFVAGHLPGGTMPNAGIVQADPPLACTPITNGAAISGLIALMDRGDCTFEYKVSNAAAAGAIGAIIVQNVVGEPIVMGGLEGVTISAIMISKEDGEIIKNYLADPNFSAVWINTTYVSPEYTDAWSDMIYGFSSRGPAWSEAGMALKPDVTAPGVNVVVAKSESGNDGHVTSGTSVAAAHVAGLAALLVEDDPAQTPAEIKARIMNGALHDIYANDNQTPPRQSPSRVGAGRIDAAASMAALMRLYDKEYPERVSVAFPEYEVTENEIFERELRIENRTSSALDLTLSLDEIRTQPGVVVSIVAPDTTLPPDGILDVVVRITVDRDAMMPSLDPTFAVSASHFLSETAGYVEVETDSLGYSHRLRVPYYAAMRPASVMNADADNLAVGPAHEGDLVLTLQGQGLESNPGYDAQLYCFEAQWRAPQDTSLSLYSRMRTPMAVGVFSNYHDAGDDVSATTLYFGVVAQADWLRYNWHSASFIEFDLNGDGAVDSFFYLDSVIRLFTHNTRILVRSAASLGLNNTHSAFHYRVIMPEYETDWLYYDVARPGLYFEVGTFGASDSPGAEVSVKYNIPNIMNSGALGAMLLHRDNTRDHRVEFLPLKANFPRVFGDVNRCAHDASELAAFVIDNAYGLGGGLWHVAGADACGLGRDALYFGRLDECDYDAGAAVMGRVVMPPLDLTEAVGPVYLTFDYKIETRAHPDRDLASVLIQVEGSPEMDVVAANHDTGLGTQRLLLTDPTTDWHSAVIDLSGYLGETIHVSFVFDSVDALDNAHFGFAVSHVCVFEYAFLADGSDDLALSPGSDFVVTGYTGSPMGQSKTYTLINEGTVDHHFYAVADAGWIDISPSEGTVEAGEDFDFIVTVTDALSDVVPGLYEADVRVYNSDTGKMWTRVVRVTIEEPLSVAPDTDADVLGLLGGAQYMPDSMVYTLTNSSAASLNWTATSSVSWLEITPAMGTLTAGGSEPVTIGFNTQTAALPVGIHAAHIYFTNTELGFAITRQITLELVAPTGTIRVTDSIAPEDDLALPFGETFIGLDPTAQITVTNTHASLPLTVSEILLGDYLSNFDSGMALGWTPTNSAQWTVTNGAYVVSDPLHTGWMQSSYTAQVWKDCEVQVTLTRTGAPTQSLVFLRATSDFALFGAGHAYGVFVSSYSTECSVFRYASSTYTTLGTVFSPAIHADGTPNMVRFRIVGDTLDAYVNNAHVWTGTDAVITDAGHVGFGGLSNAATPTTHGFSDIRVSSVPSSFALHNAPTLPATLSPDGDAFDFDVVYAPQDAVTHPGMVHLVSNDLTTPLVEVTLSGTGLEDSLEIVPVAGFIFDGPMGGPWNPVSESVSLSNTSGTDTLTLEIDGDDDWLSLMSSATSLPPGGGGTVTVEIGPGANSLLPGAHYTTLWITNTSSGVATSIPISLFVAEPLSLTPADDLTASGAAGGPFIPAAKTYTLSNNSLAAVVWTASITRSWLTLSSMGGVVGGGDVVDIVVSFNAYADGLSPGAYSDVLTVTNDATGQQFSRNISLDVSPWTGIPIDFFSETMDSDPGWSTEGEWEYGIPTGAGAGPASGHTGTTVYGYNLDGPYTNDMPARHLTTPAIDCGNKYGVTLSFMRWLGVEHRTWDSADIQVSNNGTDWVTVWSNPNSSFQDAAWVPVSYDISAVADNQAQVYLRWIMGPTDGSVVYSGWYIDDVALSGISPLLIVSPQDNFTTEGAIGGPFTPASMAYTLTNTSAADLDWTAEVSAAWLEITPASGTIAAGGSATVTVSLGSGATALSQGAYHELVIFEDTTNGETQSRQIHLAIEEPLRLTPADDLVATGKQGGPFSPYQRVYTLENTSAVSQNWQTSWTENWVETSPSSGTLTAGASVEISARFTAAAQTLVPGAYQDTLVFQNSTSGASWERQAQLNVTNALSLVPGDALSASGYHGGPYSLSSKAYTLSNTGGGNIPWTAYAPGWVDVAPGAGTLAPGASVEITATFNAAANALPEGAHAGTLAVVNDTNDDAFNRALNLNITSGMIMGTHAFVSQGTFGGPFTPDAQVYTITNFSATPIEWTGVSGAPWARIEPESGVITPGYYVQPQVVLTDKAARMPVGVYATTLRFRDVGAGKEYTCPATLTITARQHPEMDARTTMALEFSLQRGDSSGIGGPVRIWNHGAAVLDYTLEVVSAEAWLNITSPILGSVPGGGSFDSIDLLVDAGALPVGAYTAEIVARGNDPDNPEQRLAVTLTVLPDELQVTPTEPFLSIGRTGSVISFTPNNKTYTLTNTDTDTISWTANVGGATWLECHPASGTLAPDASADVLVSLTDAVSLLAAGTHETLITFSDTTHGRATQLAAKVIVSDTALATLPTTDFSFVGPQGGYFTPESAVYTLSNAGAVTMSWSADTTDARFVATPASGTLARGASRTVAITLDPSAESLSPGFYPTTITFRDNTNSLNYTRNGVLEVRDWAGLRWSPIADHKGSAPYPAALTAVDSADEAILRYARDAQLSAWRAGGPNASRVLITEVRPGGHSAVEIQNVSGQAVATEGWFVAIGDDDLNINSVNALQWMLPATLAANAVRYRTEDATDTENYWGGPIHWDVNRPGWAMLVDNTGFIVDFVAWGWLAADIAAIQVVINDFTLDIAREWLGDGVNMTASPTVSLQRVGNQDANNAGNFLLAEPASLGAQNAALVLPFILPNAALSFAPGSPVAFSNGIWNSEVTVFGQADGVRLLANDGLGMFGVSNAFNTSTPDLFVINVSAEPSIGAFKKDEEIEIRIQFSEVVEVSGIPSLDLGVGAAHSVPYVSGSGTDTLRFRYIVLESHNTPALEYASANALRDNGGAIRDAATGSRDAVLTLPAPGAPGSLGANTSIVIDNMKPVIALLGDAALTIECGDPYSDSGADAWDEYDGDLRDAIMVDGAVNTGAMGVYTLTYTVSDSAGNAATPATRTVTVEDTQTPVVTISGGNALSGDCGVAITLPEATAFDTCDGPLSATISDLDSLDTADPVPGVYHVVYRAEDAAGNVGEDTLVTTISDSLAPEIALLGDAVMTLECGVDIFTDPGATAWDACEGDLAARITVSGDLFNTDTLDIGTVYHVLYNVEDSQGNAAETVTRTVMIEDTEAPILTLGHEADWETDEDGFILLECAAPFEEPDTFMAWDACLGDLGAPVEALDPGMAGVLAHAWALDDLGNVTWVEDDEGLFFPLAYGYNEFSRLPGDYLLVYVAWDASNNSYPPLDVDGLPLVFDDEGDLDVLDQDGNLKVDFARLVRVRDTEAPVIILVGEQEITIDCGDLYEDPGVSAWDVCDGDLTDVVFVDNPVDTAVPEHYLVTYQVNDSAGNTAALTTRVVVVRDNCPPEGEGEGEPPVEGEGEPPVEGEGEPPVEGEGEPPVEGEGEPPVEGEGEPPVEGEGEPPVEGEGEPPVEGEGEPPVEGEGEPPIEGEGEPPVEGEGEPPVEGEGEPPVEGEGEPPVEGEGEPPVEGEGEPPVEGEGEPPVEGEGEPPIEGEGEPPVEGEGEPPVEGEGEPPVEGEGEPPVEGEGEPPVEGEGEPPVEGEGEPPVEGEGEPPVEGEGEPPVEGEGEPPAEGEGEGEPGDLTLSVTPRTTNRTYEAGYFFIEIATSAAWTATSNAAWATFTGGISVTSGTGTTSLRVNYEANFSGVERTGAISIAGDGTTPASITVTINQLSGTALLSVTPANKNVESPAGQTVYTIATVGVWNAVKDVDWARITNPGGAGNAAMAVTYDPNTTGVKRVATFTVTGTNTMPGAVSVTLTQHPVGVVVPSLAVTPSNRNVESPEGVATFNIETEAAWAAESDAGWAVIVSNAGTGNTGLRVNYGQNNTGKKRVATIRVTGENADPETVYVTITQQPVGVTVPPLEVTPENRNIESPDGQTSFDIVTPVAWTATSDAGWATIVNSSGTGAAELLVNHSSNTTGLRRTATITVTGVGAEPETVAVTITQMPAGMVVPSLVVTPENRDVESANGQTTFTIETTASWTASVDESWASLESDSGVGNALLRVNYSANNSGHARVAVVTVTGLDTEPNSVEATITQAYSPPSITLNAPEVVTAECGVAFTDPGATAIDSNGAALGVTANITLGGAIMPSVSTASRYVGAEYTITYTARPAAGGPITATRQVTVRDTAPPVITLNGAARVTVNCGDTYEDAGATAADQCYGDLSGDVAAVGLDAINTRQPGEYALRYEVSDAAGNAAGSVTRTVIVRDNCPAVEEGEGEGKVEGEGEREKCCGRRNETNTKESVKRLLGDWLLIGLSLLALLALATLSSTRRS